MPIDPQKAQGIDIYSRNGVFNPSLSQHRIDFVIAQSNRGLFKDPRFEQNYQTCLMHDIPFMSYNQAKSNADWKRQADVMLEQAWGKQVSMLWWAYDGAGGNTLSAKFANDTVRAMSYLKQQSMKPVGVYGNRTEIFQLYKDAPAAREFPLWFANYRTDRNYWANTPNVQPKIEPEFKDGLRWLIWQYASEKNWLGFDTGKEWGLQSWSVDLNCWNGTPAEMRAYLGMWQANDPPVEPMTLEERVDKLESEAKLRGWSI